MQPRECQARLVDDPEALCSYKVVHPLPFCREHYEEYCAAKETHRSASQEVERLKDVIDGIVKGSVDAYKTFQDLAKDMAVIRLYLEAVERRDEARETLSSRFDSELGVAPQQERTDTTVAAFAQRLEERTRELRAAEEAHKAAYEVLAILIVPHDPFPCELNPAGGPEHASPSGSAPFARIREILYSSRTAPSRPRQGDESRSLSSSEAPRRCPTNKLTSAQCIYSPLSGRRFCMLHVATHVSTTTLCRLQWLDLETCRKKMMEIKVRKGDEPTNAEPVMRYIQCLELVEKESEKHQATYSCASPENHARFLKEVRRRRLAAVFLHARLIGRKDADVALKQGQLDEWASEYLAEVKAVKSMIDKASGGAIVSAAVSAGIAPAVGGALAVGALIGATAWLVG